MHDSRDLRRDLLSALIDAIGGEPLAGSGFEAEDFDPAFMAAELERTE